MVYSISPGGTETILHTFGIGADGYFPSSALVNVGGVLYGETQAGGCGCGGAGCGTI